MIVGKSNALKITAFGAVLGAVFGVLINISFWIRWISRQFLSGKDIKSYNLIMNFPDWYWFPFLSFICFGLATFIAHRFFAHYTNSTIWFWQLVGILSVFVCSVYIIVFGFYNWYFADFEVSVIEISNLVINDWIMLLAASPVILLFNFLFALILIRRKKRLL